MKTKQKTQAEQINHFILIKQASYNKAGKTLTARQAAMALLDAGIWPLWEFTRNRKAMKAGDHVAVYLAGKGNQQVIAKATIVEVSAWSGDDARKYPLVLDGTPESVLRLATPEVLNNPVKVHAILDKLSFIKSQKWGVAFMGGTRRVQKSDFVTLTA